MPELAKAYVQIIPSADGIKGRLTEVLGGEADSAGAAAGERAGASFGNAFKGLASVGLAAVTTAGAAVGALTKGAVEGYADYEQLSGGIETLFKNSAGVVEKYAENAYRTAGLSANEYMETVTSFSASLLQSLGGDTDKAAGVADMAISDMADNANKMGTSMESIQNAYQGFAKQNYTMLDNLKLGYGGTKTEMERLLADATALSGVEYDINSLSDVYSAIHVIQDELDITGTTAKEASATISGSLGTLSSAWSNLVAGIANPDADIGTLIGNLVTSAQNALTNLLPAIQTALSGVGQLVTGLAPIIANALPELIANVAPELLTTALTLVQTVAGAIVDNLPLLLGTALELVLTLVDGIIDALPELIPAVVDVILTITEKLTEPDMIMKLIDAAFRILGAVATGLMDAIPVIVEKVPEIIMNLIQAMTEMFPQIIASGAELIAQLAMGIAGAGAEVIGKIAEIASGIHEKINERVEAAKQWGRDLLQNFIDGITAKWQVLKEKIKSVADTVKDFLGFSEPKEGPLSDFHTYAPDMMALYAKGIQDNIGVVERAVGDASSATMNAWEADRLNTAISGPGSYAFGGRAAGTATAAQMTMQPQNIEIRFAGSLAALARAIRPEILVEGRRVGAALVGV